ncbi:MAG: MFS transporter [Rubrivivax sp.]|nr:MFS transporter [Rubrivivax sp.]
MPRVPGSPEHATANPDDAARTRWPALAPFRTRSFRYQWPADLITAWAQEMEMLILGWYVLVESNSVAALALFGALLYVGSWIAPLMGTLGDRLGLRRVLGAMRLAYALLAAVILGLALAGRLQPSIVLAVAFVAGLIKPSDVGMRTALVSAAVPPAHLVAAMGITRTTGDSARIGGALAGAGFMAGLGLVGAYVAITGLYLAGAVLTARSGGRPGGQGVQGAQGVRGERGEKGADRSMAEPAAAAAPRGEGIAAHWRDLNEGLQHVWRTPLFRAGMVLAALVNLCAFPFTNGLMPYIARDVFHLDQQGLGWLVAGFATGALVGSLGLGTFGARLPPARTMLVASALWYLCLLGLALPLSVPVASVLLVATGLSQSVSMVSLSIILMRHSELRLRGRVMGARMLAVYTLPIGLVLAGVLIPAIGFAGLVAVYGIFGLLMTAAIAWVWRDQLVRRDAAANA